MSETSFRRYLGGRLQQHGGPLRLAVRFLAQVWRPRAWSLFFSMYRDRNRVARSPYFDAGWYLREYPDVARAGADPAFHYASTAVPRLRDPGPDFVSEEYLALNPDVRYVRANPLVHYEAHGRREGRPVSFLDLAEPVFPAEAAPLEADFGVAPPAHRRTALFAAFLPDGRIPETTLHYLRGLREVADNVVFVANSPVRPGEADRLCGLVARAEFRHHGAYDFGSYRRAWEIARGAGLLSPDRTDELVVANDSCYGPAVPFPETFAAMASNPADFWGLTAFRWFDLSHIQSYFFVFRRRVLDGPELGAFLSRVVPLGLRGRVILHYECRLTRALEDAGYSWDTLVPRDFSVRRGCMPTKLPATLLAEHRMPLIKAKALKGDCKEDLSGLRDLVARTAPELARILPEPLAPGTPAPVRPPRVVTLEEHVASLPAKAARIGRRAAAGEPVRAVFTVCSAAMFPARPLFAAMLADPAFEPRVLVVPDLRLARGEDPATLDAVRDDLARGGIPAERIEVARPDAFGDYPDLLAGADLVCHDTPYDVSSFRFRPRWALGRDHLTIHVNYGYFRSVYDRGVMARRNYATFWKVFFECPETLAEYRGHSILHGANAELTGYVKMDELASFPRNPGPRRRVLLCPHHSVEGGANDELALSNFLRLADHLLELPALFPQIDFVLRPHPFLFETLSRPRFWGPKRCAAWRERFLANPNASWSEGGGYLREFAAADAIVQDCGSFLVEWMYTGRPCCYVLKSDADRAKFAPLGRECLERCTVAFDARGIDAFLRDTVLGGRDPGAAEREAFRRRVALNHPHAADAALAAIRRGLGLPAAPA